MGMFAAVILKIFRFTVSTYRIQNIRKTFDQQTRLIFSLFMEKRHTDSEADEYVYKITILVDENTLKVDDDGRGKRTGKEENSVYEQGSKNQTEEKNNF